MDIQDLFYKHNGKHWYRTSGSTSIGPFDTFKQAATAFVVWCRRERPDILQAIRGIGDALMEERIHQHDDKEWYYSDPDGNRCIGPFTDADEARKAYWLRCGQLTELL